jgi:SAM-dependent methyltransferase
MTDPEYLHNQTVKYLSHEDEHPGWAEGQVRFLNEYLIPQVPNRSAVILDAGCGDGHGLAHLAAMGYTNLRGVDLAGPKLDRAAAAGCSVQQADLHDLSCITDGSVDVVYSSHVLEHCHDPARVISEFKRIMRPYGMMVIVVPHPDHGPLDAHCGSVTLRTRQDDRGAGVMAWFEEQGLRIREAALDTIREPEIWLVLTF